MRASRVADSLPSSLQHKEHNDMTLGLNVGNPYKRQRLSAPRLGEFLEH